MKIYNIDFDKLVRLNLPTFLQNTRFAVLYAALRPIRKLYNEFLTFRNEILTTAGYNSQVCHLRKMLNDKFDYDLRRITIGESALRRHLWLYKREENKPLNLGRIMLNRRDLIQHGSEFIVNVPLALQNKEKEIISNLNYYKLPTKLFTIKYF